MKNKFSILENVLWRSHAKTNLHNKKFEYPKIEYTYYEKRNLVAVRINESVIFARVFVDLDTPFPDKVEGKLKLNFSSSQLIEPLKELWSPNLEALEYGRIIERGLRGHIIDLSKLVVTNEKVWSICIELHCFSVDGNVIDCGFYAALESLKRAKIPFEKYGLETQVLNWLNLDCYCKTLYVYKNKIHQNTNVYEMDVCETGLTTVIVNDAN